MIDKLRPIRKGKDDVLHIYIPMTQLTFEFQPVIIEFEKDVLGNTRMAGDMPKSIVKSIDASIFNSILEASKSRDIRGKELKVRAEITSKKTMRIKYTIIDIPEKDMLVNKFPMFQMLLECTIKQLEENNKCIFR